MHQKIPSTAAKQTGQLDIRFADFLQNFHALRNQVLNSLLTAVLVFEI